MLKMTMELAKTFQYNKIRVLDKQGRYIETFNGEKSDDLFLLGHGYLGHTVYSINPGGRFVNGELVVTLDIWIED